MGIPLKGFDSALLEMKQMGRAMRPFVMTLYEAVFESKDAEVLEIGVRQAQSTRSILAAIRDLGIGHLTSIDISDSGYERVPEGMRSDWTFVHADSKSDSAISAVSDRKYDVIFIDGDHSAGGVAADFINYAPLLKTYEDGTTGIMLFHDVLNVEPNGGVKLFWDTIPKEAYVEKMTLLPWPGFGLLRPSADRSWIDGYNLKPNK